MIVSDLIHVGYTFNDRLKAVGSEFLNEVVISDPVYVGHTFNNRLRPWSHWPYFQRSSQTRSRWPYFQRSSQTPFTLAILSTIVSDPVHVGHTFNDHLRPRSRWPTFNDRLRPRSRWPYFQRSSQTLFTLAILSTIVSDPVYVGHTFNDLLRPGSRWLYFQRST